MGMLAGMLGGFLGIGGGAVLVPLLLRFSNIEEHKVYGTSLMVIFPLSISGALVYALLGNVDGLLALKVALGGVVGVSLGAYASARLPTSVLRWCFAFLLGVIGIRLLIWA